MRFIALFVIPILFIGCVALDETRSKEEWKREGNICLTHKTTMIKNLVGFKREGYMLGKKTVWIRDNAPNAKYPVIYGCVGRMPIGLAKVFVCKECNKAVIGRFGTLAYDR